MKNTETGITELNTRRRTPAYLAIPAVLSIGALTLTACGPGDEDANGEQEPTTEVTVGAEDGENATAATEGGQDDAANDTGDSADDGAQDEGAADEGAVDDGAGEDGSGDSESLYEAVAAVLEEYPDGVITELDTESSYYEFFVYDGETEWELEVDNSTFKIIDTEDDGIDDDDREKAEAVEIEFEEALRTAEETGGATPTDAELDTESGTVVWEIELSNDSEVYVDVTNGEVVNTSN